jgi:hypothetical protein
MENFNAFMNGLFGSPGRLHWTDWFPFDKVCFDGYDTSKGSDCVWVDVGGGKGHHTQEMLEKYPNTLGRFVVQDLGLVIDDIAKSGVKRSPRIENQKHDFLTPQPVKGARTYWLANILHNWADPVCNVILANLREAMTPGYSKLIVANMVMADDNVPLRQSGLDIAMLYLHSGSQRSDAEWRELLESAGFKVINVWLPPGDSDGIIEAEVPVPRS